MGRKVAVMLIHGIGNQTGTFADRVITEIDGRCRPTCGDDIVIRPAHWAHVMDDEAKLLWQRFDDAQLPLRWNWARRFIVELLGDAIAYQPTRSDRRAYMGIHAAVAAAMNQLAHAAGPDAPLCIIAHSLGTVIASNYLYDLEVKLTRDRDIVAQEVRAEMDNTPLERGETLTLLYTLGSPLALWSLRYSNFGTPINLPSPVLFQHHPTLPPLAEWRNYFDPDDPIGFPLKTLNEAYSNVVTADEPIEIGDMFTGWNPTSHLAYWTAQAVITPISDQLIRVWRSINAV